MRWRVRPTGSPSKSPSVVTSASQTRSVEQRYRYPPIWLKDTPSARRFNSFVVSALPLAPRRSFTANLKSPGTWIFWATVVARPSSRWPSASFDSSSDSFGSWAHEPHTHHSPFPIPLSPSRKGVKNRLRDIERRRSRKKRRRQRPPTLPLKFRDEVRRGHIDRDTRRQRQPVVDQERDLAREGHARERRRAQHGRRADRLPARPPPRHHEARHGHALRKLMKEDRDEHHHAERRAHEKRAGDGDGINKGVQQQPHERRGARHPIDGVGLLAEVKVRRQGVLREMHSEVARQHQRRRRRARARERFRRSEERRVGKEREPAWATKR